MRDSSGAPGEGRPGIRALSERARRTARGLGAAMGAKSRSAAAEQQPGEIVEDRLRHQVARLRERNEKLQQQNERLHDRLAARAANEARRIEALMQMFRSLGRTYGVLEPDPEAENEEPGRLPGPMLVAKVETAALARHAFESLIERLTADEDFPAAAVATTRALLTARSRAAARSFAQLLQHQQSWASTGDICVAVVIVGEPMVGTAWTLLSRTDLSLVLHLAPVEYFRAAFECAPQTAKASLEAIRAGDLEADADAEGWLAIAQFSFAAQLEELSSWALDRAEELLDRADEETREQVSDDIARLRSWYGRLSAAPPELPAGEIPFALLDLQQPDRSAVPTELDDYLEPLAALGQLVRHRDVQFTGPDDLTEFAAQLRRRVPADDAILGPSATVRLHRVHRDVTSYCAVPDGTWLIVAGELPHAMFELRTDMPFDARVRPIFASIHIDRPLLLTSDVIDYLRRHAPIGCRDWRTVALLQAAKIPAYFAGALATTLNTVVRAQPPQTAPDLPVPELPAAELPAPELPAPEPTVAAGTDLIEQLTAALQHVDQLAASEQKLVPERLHAYLAARGMGLEVDYQPLNPAAARFDGLLGLDDAAVAGMQAGLTSRLAAVLTAILSGKSEDEVYSVWREVCAAEVQRAEAWRHELPPIPPPTFDVAQACAEVHRNSVTVERCAPGPGGAEINVEFSLDANYAHQLAVVLNSIVERCSRPVRAFVLCRDLGADDFAHFAALFPTVSFVWLPTDHVDYGPLSGMISHITVSTMDRLLLPDLLPDVTRVIHHDLDALCLADLAELYDIDLGGNPIAGRDNPHPNFGSGFLSVINYAEHRLQEAPELASELVRRTHLLHDFDYEVFNAGILVLDLAQMRADSFSRDYLPFAQRFGLHDQHVLNIYAGARRTAFETSWNRFPRYEVVESDAKILHWLGQGKPWRRTYIAAREYWKQAELALAEREQSLPNPPTAASG
ncbi:MAG TPA: glycosyltransferase [Jatrophihabitans sp.]|nr:glycosyltransferase [Jatrophihabitans sp.]